MTTETKYDPSARFSKSKLRAFCIHRMELLDGEFRATTRHHIDPRSGTSQIRGAGEEAARIYGEWRAMSWVLNALAEGDL